MSKVKKQLSLFGGVLAISGSMLMFAGSTNSAMGQEPITAGKCYFSGDCCDFVGPGACAFCNGSNC
ncbi:MAG: hypothetical protein AAGA64_13800 [Bacteroidota bacterium]